MRPVLRYKTWTSVAIILAGVAVALLVGCQFATAALDQTQTSAPGSPCPLAPSAPSALHCWLGGYCLVATLPPVVSPVCTALCTPYATEWVAHPTEFADPPFIPPEDLRCARSSSQAWIACVERRVRVYPVTSSA
jgi:hypothetical protein